MKKICLLFVCLLFAVGSPAVADEMVSVKLGYQMLSPSGTFAGETAGVGTAIDMEDDLNFDDSKDMTAEVALQFGNGRLSLGYTPLDFSGTGTGTYDFNGKNFTGAVKGEVSADIYDIGFTYYLLNLDDIPARLQLGLELAVKVFDGEASLDSLVLPKEVVSCTAPIPTVGVRTRVALADFIGIVGRIGYLEYDGNSFLDAEAQVEISPLPLVGIYAGYRIFDLSVDEADLVLDVEFSGPFAGALVRF